MTYASQQDLVDRFGEPELVQLTDIGEVTEGGIVSDVLDRALEDADAEIDGYLESRYRLPLASVPRLLVGMAADIARYKLYRDAVPAVVERRYKDAVKILENIAAGKVSLGRDSDAAPAPVTDGAQFGQSTRVFGRDVQRIVRGGHDD